MTDCCDNDKPKIPPAIEDDLKDYDHDGGHEHGEKSGWRAYLPALTSCIGREKNSHDYLAVTAGT